MVVAVVTPEEPERTCERAALLDGLLAWARVSSEAVASDCRCEDGPFFLGSYFSAADVALSPWWPQR